MKVTAWIQTEGHQREGVEAGVQVRDCPDGIQAVFADAVSAGPLCPDFGMGIEIDVEGEVEEYMADYRHSEFWCRPHFGTDFTQIPDETQTLVYRRKNGTFGVILPVVSEQYKCVLKGTESGLVARLFSWSNGLTTCSGLAFVCGEGEDPFAVMERCVETALTLLNSGYPSRKDRRYPDIFEYLGWCSWDAMQIRVSEEGVLEKCREFQEKKIPVQWALLDDMWAEVHEFYGAEYANFREMVELQHRSTLYSFEADPLRFPEGLKHCIDKVKECGLRVGIWHPTTGYWRGLDPEGDAYAKVKDYLLETQDGRHISDYKTEKAYMFYKTFHDFLRRCGAEMIKIDNQSMVNRFYKGLAPVGEIARSYHDGMEASVGEHFDNAMINCMGMASEDMWNRAISPISRCSDDFMPENSEWFHKHILQCSYNSFVQGQFYYCDWDMWWSDDGQAEKNSILRGISGGPIYVSDPIGRSKKEILDPLVLSDGRILRCDRPAMPTADCLTKNPETSGEPFKVQNICGDSGILAAFNLDREDLAVQGTISPSDVEGLEGETFAVYEYFTGEVQILNREARIPLALRNGNEYKLYLFVPYVQDFAALGDVSKFVAPKTIRYKEGDRIQMYEDVPCTCVKNGKLCVLASASGAK